MFASFNGIEVDFFTRNYYGLSKVLQLIFSWADCSKALANSAKPALRSLFAMY
jgi:hypothetical protein